MHIRSSWPARLYLALASVACLIGIGGFVRLSSQVGRPFGGFIWQFDDVRGFSVSYDVPQHWNGPQHGLAPYSALLAINGYPPNQFAAVYANADSGSLVTYALSAGSGATRTEAVPVELFGWAQVGSAYGLIFLAALAFAGAGFMLLRSARRSGRRLIAWIMLVGSLPAFYHSHHGSISQLYYSRWLLALMWAPCPALLGALLCHLALVYPHRQTRLLRFRWLLHTLYGLAFVLAFVLGCAYLWGASPRIAVWQIPATNAGLGYMLLGALATVVSGTATILFKRSTIMPQERHEARILAGAWVLSMLLLAGTLAAANLRWPTPFEYLISIAWLLPLGLVYAIGNTDLIARIEDESATRADLLLEVRDVHRLQERILEDLADQLHDTALADSKALEMRLYALSHQIGNADTDHMALRADLHSIYALSLAVQRSLRQIVEGAKPVDFELEPLSVALMRMTQQINTVSLHTRYQCEFSGRVDDCTSALSHEIYWIIQAAANNVRDHARAASCTIRLAHTAAAVELEIEDDGVGTRLSNASPAAEPTRRQLGLASIRTRAARVGGHFHFEQHRSGTRLQLSIPLVDSPHSQQPSWERRSVPALPGGGADE